MSVSRNSIVLLAKKSGITSFSSLWQIKDALDTRKVGHTGTLDTFAEGLLVALSGSLTRLCPLVTDSDKEYLAQVFFGTETDTLDPDGVPVKNGPLPSKCQLENVLSIFTGTISQRPPIYSAVHVSGKRASDLARQGESVVLDNRLVTIYELHLIDAFTNHGRAATGTDLIYSAIFSVRCSKGTYIRSLARDIAYAVNTCAYLGSLRRTRIGPFFLENAAGADELQEFASSPPQLYNKGIRPVKLDPQCIRNHSFPFTPELASVFGYDSLHLKPSSITDFLSGKKIADSWFISGTQLHTGNSVSMVFCSDEFIGAVKKSSENYIYEFVSGGR